MSPKRAANPTIDQQLDNVHDSESPHGGEIIQNVDDVNRVTGDQHHHHYHQQQQQESHQNTMVPLANVEETQQQTPIQATGGDSNDIVEINDSGTRTKSTHSMQNEMPKDSNRDQSKHNHRNDIAVLMDRKYSFSATDYRNAGNKLCSLHRYDDALICYAKAIEKDPSEPIYYSNKALCHLKLQQWSLAEKECRKALELDSNLIKAHFFLGQTLAELGQFDGALKHLQLSYEFAKEKQLNYGDDIAYQIRLTKRRRWSKIENENSMLQDELHGYLVNLIKKDRDAKYKELNDRLHNLRGEGSSSQSFSGTEKHDNTTLDDSEANIQESQSKIETKCDIYLDKLQTMFTNLRSQQSKHEVPDYLCGKISFEIMRDPVVTPSGITYDRQDIEEHLKRVGHFDPITRQPLTVDSLIPNLAMKEVVDAYLSENEWANYY